MAGGQQITSGQGTIIALGGDNNKALTGSASISAVQTPSAAVFIRLASRKAGGGTATAVLVGQGATFSQGTLVYVDTGTMLALTGQAMTSALGTLLWRGQVTLAWDAVTDSDLAGYRIYHGTTSGIYNSGDTQDVGNVLTGIYGGLLPGFTHYFVVRAYDTSNNESGSSNEISRAF